MLLVLTVSWPVSAQLYKCVDANGATEYSQVPCPSGTDQKTFGPSPTKVKPAERKSMLSDDLMGSIEENDAFIMLKLLASSKLREASAGEAGDCVERYRQRFKDPASVYPVTATVYRDADETFVHVDVSARNGFGGASRTNLVCPL